LMPVAYEPVYRIARGGVIPLLLFHCFYLFFTVFFSFDTRDRVSVVTGAEWGWNILEG
jgi:hypothetical protein